MLHGNLALGSSIRKDSTKLNSVDTIQDYGKAKLKRVALPSLGQFVSKRGPFTSRMVWNEKKRKNRIETIFTFSN